jgi:RNA polymerase sigma-70 factor (ECF subfamily)
MALKILKSDIKKMNEVFEQQTVPHMDYLYNYAVKMTGNKKHADDLIKETYKKAFNFWIHLDEGTDYKSWMFRIIRNTYINSFRKKNKFPDNVDYETIENFYDKIKSSITNNVHLDKDIYENLNDDEISKAISSLPEDFRTVVILCDILGNTYEQIADFIDVPVGTVQSRLYRARKMLFTKFYKYPADEGYGN